MITVALALVYSLGAQDWPQWRGPERSGIAAGFTAPGTWPKSLRKEWSAPIAGGYATPVTTQTAIYVFGRESDQEVLQAVDRASGRMLWRKSYAAPFRKNQYATEMGMGPHGTPLIAGGRIYTLGIMGVLSCHQTSNGELLWRKDFSKSIDTANLFTGTAMSPLLDSGMLIVQVGDDRKGSLIAYDPATGAQKWIWENEGASYTSPVIAEIDGVRQIITLAKTQAVGVSVRQGKLLWSVEFKDQWNENIVTPLVAGSRVIFSGVRKGTFAVALKKSGDSWSAKTLWQNAEYTMYMSSPVLDGNHLYGMTNKRKGQVFCMDVETGKVLWSTPGREGMNVSLVSAGPFLFTLNETGDLKIARRNPSSFDIVAEYKVADNATWPQPVVLGRNLLIRDAASLTMYRLD
ncbi:MAG: PQQ-binding-like beta-propeller repeat protein [Bryobacterales bacterium]|nr:PQQ-binding-like beta-propeller repeat protein [Bryobacterales bacterium]